MEFIKDVKFDEKGLVPAVVQDYSSDQVLMLAYMNVDAIEKSMETGFAHYYSRSRQRLWKKGETSGNTQAIKEMSIDCDGDTILIRVEQRGPACHTGQQSCFYRTIQDEKAIEMDHERNSSQILAKLYKLIVDRKTNKVEGSYTNYLFDKGIDKILKKVGEETTEVVIAAKNPSKDELCCEISDLFYHLTILMVEKGVNYEDIFKELENRNRK